jgi:hypothetical protein
MQDMMHRRAIYDTSQEGEQGKHKAMLDLAQIFIIKIYLTQVYHSEIVSY